MEIHPLKSAFYENWEESCLVSDASDMIMIQVWTVGQVTVEKNELSEENSALEAQIEKLQSELETSVAQSKPDLNVPPEFQQPELTPDFAGKSLGLTTVDATLQQTPTVFVIPFHPDLQADQAYPLTSSHVSKPHARYPTPADSWPAQLLGQQLAARKEVQVSGSNSSICNPGEWSPLHV